MPALPPCAAPEMRLTLDVDDGLRRILGNRPLYYKLLQRFRHDHQALADQIRVALSQAHFTLAQEQLHTLKGASGMIGAYAVYDLSILLEIALQNRAPNLVALLSALDLALNELNCSIASLIPDQQASLAPLAASAVTPALLRQLEHYLRESDGAAIALIEQAPAALCVHLGPIPYQHLVAAVQTFQFDAALAILLRCTEPGPA